MFFRHEAQTAPAERAPSHETRERHESLAIPREAVEQSAPRASVQNGPEDYKPEFGSTVMASTRWTKGRGNTPFYQRAIGAAAELVVTPFVMVVRGTLFALKGAYDGMRTVLAFGTSILKDLGPVGRVAGFLVMAPAVIVGGVCGAVYGGGLGVYTAGRDGLLGAISVGTGGNANYFARANRAYRD